MRWWYCDGGLVAMDPNGRPVQPRRIRNEDVPAEDISQKDQLNEAKRFDGVKEAIPFFPGQTFHLKLEYSSQSNDDACASSTDSDDIAPTLPSNIWPKHPLGANSLDDPSCATAHGR